MIVPENDVIKRNSLALILMSLDGDDCSSVVFVHARHHGVPVALLALERPTPDVPEDNSRQSEDSVGVECGEGTYYLLCNVNCNI